MMTAQLEAAIADRFDLLKDSFPDDLNGYQLLETAIRNHIESLQGSLLLDLGCGKGRFHSLWESAGLNSIGMDRSCGMLRGGVCVGCTEWWHGARPPCPSTRPAE